MMHPADLPDTLAVFPLPRAILLPRARLPLHIFEPRYLQMFEDALKTPERLIGMVQPCPQPASAHQSVLRQADASCSSAAGGEPLHRIGCAGRVTQFSETEDGRYLVTLAGLSRFRIQGEVAGFCPYRRCDVTWDGFERDLGVGEADTQFDRADFLALLERFFSAQGLSTDWESLQDAEDELLINSLSMLLEFDAEDKQALLEAPCLVTRRETLVTLIEFALRGGAHEDILQ
ncbi:LON peptidase substrate-binding domain-containing protein [Pseudophaeobacter flagellatus]|uniref:LON peptidase substrate-binding domain-containing protein n=1 Tax=Pseudophaeobacter flagellatus TaxID=2899119 RepID=UPI001E639FDE|nr:LON peptidase substrate-binding domain-containing protein [Pseudophaeobacter flagellatus]MCD9147284.1 LON peptidase substrate-binding domain-containing protein [Pseudophaeobacter flagellatus]